ncbi:hypothetical protein K1719_028426 [Acacia pycnantha]|nr:hypothetical protein K1719_028426 [Acacia pycnantha]
MPLKTPLSIQTDFSKGGHIASGEAPSCSSCNSSPRIADSSIPRRRIAENNIADLEKQPGYYSDYSDVVVVEDDDHDYSNESSAWGHWDAHIQSLLPLHNTMASTCLTSHFSISARGWVMWEVIQLLKRVPQHIHTETTSSTIEWALTELLCNPETLPESEKRGGFERGRWKRRHQNSRRVLHRRLCPLFSRIY